MLCKMMACGALCDINGDRGYVYVAPATALPLWPTACVWCAAAPVQAAADLALRRSNQTAALEALFELLFRSVGRLLGWWAVPGSSPVHICALQCLGRSLSNWRVVPSACFALSLRRVLKNCSSSGLMHQPDGEPNHREG